jgi:hypothetical protein
MKNVKLIDERVRPVEPKFVKDLKTGTLFTGRVNSSAPGLFMAQVIDDHMRVIPILLDPPQGACGNDGDWWGDSARIFDYSEVSTIKVS